ncbi:charged multivesicular body protein 2b [Ixodes scapularis]|uniref:Vacuolar assembly/sorting protein DID4, putative n=2 Tax=Ixodes TaxID=6944 RepID=B7PRV9_IXOSC|nr:charged multivesicular body protein 2b [Ixodes scapularis]EEC09331.1 vacuolar assembly/sorting protein DID4, putative [Ixodes scapularis]|eukprot:XP_002401285.1 vacuolar assembly/sorting protein DID4, putative [Ixodes scapularis]
MSLFGKKVSPAEQMRQQNRNLRKAQRDIEKDRRDLERQEKQLELEIKKAAKEGNKQVCTVLAKQLVQVRKQKARTYTASSKVQAVGAQSKTMHANVKLADAMATTAKTMGEVNKSIKPQDIARTMQEFEKETTKMGMTEEIVDDTLNSILDESGDEEEQDAIVNQVLDEIGIEVSGKMANAPSAMSDPLGHSSKAKLPSDDEIERQLAKLKT